MSVRPIASLIAVAASLALPVLAAPVAIVGGNVWTGTSQGTIPSGIVVIDKGQVVSVSKAGSPGGDGYRCHRKMGQPGLYFCFLAHRDRGSRCRRCDR